LCTFPYAKPKPVYKQDAITVLWNQAVHTDREVTAKRPDIIIKNKRDNMRTPRSGNTHIKKCLAQGKGKEATIQDFTYRNTMNG